MAAEDMQKVSRSLEKITRGPLQSIQTKFAPQLARHVPLIKRLLNLEKSEYDGTKIGEALKQFARGLNVVF